MEIRKHRLDLWSILPTSPKQIKDVRNVSFDTQVLFKCLFFLLCVCILPPDLKPPSRKALMQRAGVQCRTMWPSAASTSSRMKALLSAALCSSALAVVSGPVPEQNALGCI